MRRPRRGSSFRSAATYARLAGPLVLSPALLLGTPGLVAAAPDTSQNSVSELIADVAKTNQQLQDLGAEVQAQQESVNKALVDVQTARDDAATAQLDVEASQRAVRDANAAIAEAQKRFDTFAAATYVSGPSASYLTASDPDDIIATATASRALAVSSERVMDNLQRARTEQVNKESAARLAKQKADQAAADADSSKDAAVAALTDSRDRFDEQQTQIDQLAAERRSAQAKLDAARNFSVPAAGQAIHKQAAASGDRWDPGAQGPAGPAPIPAAGVETSQWDVTLPMVPSANVADPIAIVNAVLAIGASAMEFTAELGRKFLTKLGILKPTDTGITNGAIPVVYGSQATEYVIRRAGSQMGVPYSWGGGNAAGPSRGIDSGAGTVGFDCSGLILFAFAGAGIKLPHYSGAQYEKGRKIPTSQMRRGDVVFYGPGGSQHVALYLGGDKMLEAPYTGSHVKISPLRTSGMTPYAIRYIES